MRKNNRERTKYKSNPEYREQQKERVKRQREEIKKFILSYKLAHPCKICGEGDPDCLDFHHLDPTQKESNINNLAQSVKSIPRLLKEIDKCILLCANCHRKFHANLKRGINTLANT